jgi:hypothetical protein
MKKLAILKLTPEQSEQMEPLYQEWVDNGEPKDMFLIGQVWTEVIRVKMLTREELIESVKNATVNPEFDAAALTHQPGDGDGAE